jgi:hypothetical protein
MEDNLRSSETSVLTRAAWHNIPEDGILYEDQVGNCYIISYAHCNNQLNPKMIFN